MTSTVAAPAPAVRPSETDFPSAPVPPADPRPSTSRHAAILALLVAALTLVAFWPVTRLEFVNYDDPTYVYDNAQVQRGLTLDGVSWAFATTHFANYHPLTWVSLMLDRTLWGDGPRGFHATNLILHAANSVLLLLVVRAMTGSTFRAAAVAAIWAVHPLRVESVAWVSERKDVLSSLFGLLTLAAYVGYAKAPSRARYLTVIMTFALCLLSKPTWVTLPAAMLLLDVWPLRRMTREVPVMKHLVREKLPLLGMSAASCVVTIVAQSRSAAIGSLESYPFLDRVGNALIAYASYLAKMVRPTDLAIFYPHQSPGAVAVAIAVVVLLAVTAVVIWRRKQNPAMLVGWLWFLGTLVPMIGLVQAGAQSMADRFTYVPMIGVLLAVAFALPAAWLQSQRARMIGGVATLAVCVALVGLTRRQVGHWQDSLSLFEHAIAVTRDNHVAHNSLGYELTRLERFPEAAAHYEQALRIKPNYASALNGMGVVLARQGDATRATEFYQRAVDANPSHALARKNLAVRLLDRGTEADVTAAIEHLRHATELRPEDAGSHHLLGVELAKRGELLEGAVHLMTAVDLDPANAAARVDLGRALTLSGQPGAAVEHFDAALGADPAMSDAHYHAGVALARLGKLDAAADRFRAALRLSPGDRDAQLALEQVIAQRSKTAAIDAAP